MAWVECMPVFSFFFGYSTVSPFILLSVAPAENPGGEDNSRSYLSVSETSVGSWQELELQAATYKWPTYSTTLDIVILLESGLSKGHNIALSERVPLTLFFLRTGDD